MSKTSIPIVIAMSLSVVAHLALVLSILHLTTTTAGPELCGGLERNAKLSEESSGMTVYFINQKELCASQRITGNKALVSCLEPRINLPTLTMPQTNQLTNDRAGLVTWKFTDNP